MKLAIANIQGSKVLTKAERLSNGQLELTFTSGVKHRYRNVSESKFKALVMADSVGSFFNHSIRDNVKHQVNI